MTTLRSLTVPLGDLSLPVGLLEYLHRDDVLCWVRQERGLLGFGETASFTAEGADRFQLAQQWWANMVSGAAAGGSVDNRVGGPGTGLAAFGSFTFSGTSTESSVLTVPRVILGSGVGSAGADLAPDAVPEGGRWVTLTTVDPAEELTPEAAEAALAEYLMVHSPERTPDPADTLVPGSLSETEWKAAVVDAVARIEAGELSKLVLARDVVAHLSSPVAVAQVLRELAVRYRNCWTYSVRGLVGSTPEMLIKVEGNRARARVLAGTLDRANAPADPGYAAEVLAGSEKQRHEHAIAIESLTRQLEPFTRSMTAPGEPFVLELPNVWHLASDVTAELSPVPGMTATHDDDANGVMPTSLALAEALHPTAAVCGTPTKPAAELLRRLEQMDRGRYAGPVGWIDGAGNGEWGIALRGAVVEGPQTVRLYAGCGIVSASDPEAELAETWSKFRPMMEALGLQA